jgi:hypothetical protein
LFILLQSQLGGSVFRVYKCGQLRYPAQLD